ncbi:hypothetical protein J4526_07555 [Desulfurococcaceae archaeon MEX13E-LK6-19]|nr:hypothetical protein J4526_07555 [Desulfurococcaceae archaeon MEX13E-LK6-19]
MFEERLLKLNEYLNNNPTLYIPQEMASKFSQLIDKRVLEKSVGGVYRVNWEKLAKYLARNIGMKGKPKTCSFNTVFIEEKYENNISLIFYLVYSIADDFVRCITDVGINEFIVPLVFMPLKLIDELYEKHYRLVGKLASDILNESRILLLFPILLPLPSEHELVSMYVESINKLRESIKEIPSNVFYADEYDYLANHRKSTTIKALVTFSFLYDLLNRYGFSGFKNKRGWKSSSKWFEETVKLLLVNEYVQGIFSKNVTDYLVKEYKTGGPCQEDIAIPIKREDRADILIVDTKLRKDDICRILLSSAYKHQNNKQERQVSECKHRKQTESLIKYEHYITVKSDKLRKLEELLQKETPIGDYYLVFIQRVKPSIKCLENLNSVKPRGYKKIMIYSIEDFAEILTKSQNLVD